MDPNVMEGVLTPQDMFNLKVDTQARWDKISSDKNNLAIPAPKFPAYNFDTNPLNKDTQIDIYEGLFSDNAAIKETAKQALNNKIMADNNVKYKTGFKIDTPYDQAAKYIDTDFGFDPTRDNEQLLYENTYANQSFMNKTWQNLGKGLGRFSGSVMTKLGQTIGHLGAMVISAFPEMGDMVTGHNNNNWMETVADNAFSKWFEEGEQRLKDQWLPIFKPNDWDQKGFFEKLGSGQFWSDEIADGAAFMGEMIATTWITGGLGRLAGLGKIGAMGITGTSDIAKFSRGAVKFATGADDLAGIGTWAVAIAGEAGFEASTKYHAIKEMLRKQRENGENNLTDEQINEQSSDGAASSFKGNMLALGLSTAFENRFIFQPLLRKFKGKSAQRVRGSEVVNNPIAKNIDVSNKMNVLDEVAEATSARPTYSSKLEGFLNIRKKLKDPQGALRFYGGMVTKGFVAEGLWEENAQLAIERLSQDNSLNLTSFAEQYATQTKGAFTGKDRENETSIGLGGVIAAIGGGGTSIVTGQRKKLQAETKKRIDSYNLARTQYLNFQNIFERDQDGNLIKEGDSYKVDKAKAQGMIEGINKHMDMQLEIDDVTDPIQRRLLQDSLLSNFTLAAKSAGIWASVADRFEQLGALTPKQIHSLGFDASTKENLPAFLKSFAEQGKIYDEVYESRRDVDRPKGTDIQEYNTVNGERKYELYSKRTTIKALQRALEEYTTLGNEQKVAEYEETKSLEAANSVAQQYNSLQMQMYQLMAFKGTLPKDSKFYDDFFDGEMERMAGQIERINKSMEALQMTQGSTTRIQNAKGFEVIVANESYKEFFNADGTVKPDKEAEMSAQFEEQNKDFYRHADITNAIAQMRYVDKKISSTQYGYPNYLEYKKHVKAIKDIEDEIEEERQEEIAKKEAAKTAATGTITTTGTTTTEKKETTEVVDTVDSLKKQLQDFILEAINELKINDNAKEAFRKQITKDGWYEFMVAHFDQLSGALGAETSAAITDIIEAINEKVKEAIQPEDVAKVEKEVSSQFSPEKVAEVTQTVKEFSDLKLIPNVYEARALEGPMSFLKFVYDQSISTATTTKPDGTTVTVSAHDQTETTFGKEMVKLAEETFGPAKPPDGKIDSKPPEEKFEITSLVRQQLYDLGYTKEDVDKMKPLMAQGIIETGLKPKAKGPIEVVSDTEYADFIDKGKVTQERLIDIADKVKNQKPLSDREKEIFTDKTSEINKIIVAQSPVAEEKQLSEESISLLEESYNLWERGLEEIKTYEQLLKELGIFQNDNKIDKAVDHGKMTGNVTVPTQKPNEINPDGTLTVTESAPRMARFAFLQKLADNEIKGDNLKLVLFIATGKKGKKVIKGKVADKKGNILRFDKDANIVSTGTELIFDLDMISYNTSSLPKQRAVAAGVKIDPMEEYKKGFKLDEAFVDENGVPIPNADVRILEAIESSPDIITTSINFVTQGQLLRPGITNDPNSLTDLSGKRETLKEILEAGMAWKDDRGKMASDDLSQNSIFIKSGRLNVRLKRNKNKEKDGFEIVEFIPGTVGSLQNKGKSISDILTPLFEQAVKGVLPAEYEDFMKKILNRKKFLILRLGTSVLVVERIKFMKTIGSVQEATDADLLADRITSLTTVDDLMADEFNIDRELYENVSNYKAIAVAYPSDVAPIIENYPDFVAGNVTSSAKTAVYGENKEGYVRVNKRLVVTLDSNFADIMNMEMKKEQEGDAGTVITPTDNVTTSNLMKDKADTDEDVDDYLKALKDKNC